MKQKSFTSNLSAAKKLARTARDAMVRVRSGCLGKLYVSGGRLREVDRCLQEAEKTKKKRPSQALKLWTRAIERAEHALRHARSKPGGRIKVPARLLHQITGLLADIKDLADTSAPDLFDHRYYLSQAPELGDISWEEAWAHYRSKGWKKGLDPHPLFDSAWYAAQRTNQAQATPPTGKTATPSLRQAGSVTKPAPPEGYVYVFTSICLNYVSKAKVLAETMKRHNPEFRFCLLVNEPIPDGLLDGYEMFDEVLTAEQLEIEKFKSWLFKHTVVELSTAVKASMLLELLERKDCRMAFYFDPDIAVFAPLTPVVKEMEKTSIVLTPHLTAPEKDFLAVLDNEVSALKHGIYNLGFIGVRPTEQGKGFARWWRDRLRELCRADIPNGLFTDQRWIDLVPAFYSEHAIIRHPGCNVATWNLSHRLVQGGRTEGFTVNGEPLIFYHFSGIDSGAQEVMLGRYGKEMPAAHELRGWYLSATERADERALSSRRWAYSCFSNGVTITNDERRLYREREDLQCAFPDPFDTSDERASFHHWYEANNGPKDTRGASRIKAESPLEHYLRVGWKEGLKPNPMFDGNWYLQQHAPAALSKLNPLLHYARHGMPQGLAPSPDFDVAWYASQFPARNCSNWALLHYMQIGRASDARTNPWFDAERDQDALQAIVEWATEDLPLIIVIQHFGGGGTGRHVADIGAHLDRVRQLILTPMGNGRCIRVAPFDPCLNIELLFDPRTQLEELKSFLMKCRPSRLHLHHLLGNEGFLRSLVCDLGIPYDFTIHDYYVISPNASLVGSDSRFVGEDLFAHEKELIENATGTATHLSLAEWQEEHRWVLEKAARVIAPSVDVATRFRRYFRDVNIVTASHLDRKDLKTPPVVHPLNPRVKLRIAYVGDLLPHKGLEVLRQSAELAMKFGRLLEFRVIGAPPTLAALDQLEMAGVAVTGRYEESEIDRLIHEERPHLLWFPAQCPETYSYTLSIALASGLPVVASALGSFPERLSGRSWTWLCPWDLDPVAWITFFSQIREEHFIPGLEPERPPTRPQASKDFYEEEYLAPLYPERLPRSSRKSSMKLEYRPDFSRS